MAAQNVGSLPFYYRFVRVSVFFSPRCVKRALQPEPNQTKKMGESDSLSTAANTNSRSRVALYSGGGGGGNGNDRSQL